MEISKPIFIVGVPRSGTTLLYDYMACHESLGWFSQYDLRDMLTDDYLHFQYLRRRLFQIRRWPFQQEEFVARFNTWFETPQEFGLFWNRWIPKPWARSYDVNDQSKNELRKGVENLLKNKRKSRFLSKNPSHSTRIEYLNQVFPGSIFVNLVRDGRSVVSSMTKPARLFNTPDFYFGITLKKNNQMEFDLLERHARQWIEINEEIQEAFLFGLDKEQHINLKYEDFIAEPKKTLKKIFQFCNLKEFEIFDKGYQRILDKGMIEPITEKLKSANKKYLEEFSDSQIKRLESLMHDSLIRFEYA